jgi:uncharacterized lipoprotein YmbA
MNPRAVVCIAVLIGSGCAQKPPPNLYVISATPEAASRTWSHAEPVVAVTRARLPEYLERSQLVSRNGANALVLDDDNHWGEPLSDSVPRVLAENLSHYLPSARVVLPEDARGQKVPYEYVVALDAYEPDGTGNVVMRGHWVLRDIHTGTVVSEGDIDERRPLESPKASDAVAGMNETLNDASRQIAEASVGKLGR